MATAPPVGLDAAALPGTLLPQLTVSASPKIVRNLKLNFIGSPISPYHRYAGDECEKTLLR